MRARLLAPPLPQARQLLPEPGQLRLGRVGAAALLLGLLSLAREQLGIFVRHGQRLPGGGVDPAERRARSVQLEAQDLAREDERALHLARRLWYYE